MEDHDARPEEVNPRNSNTGVVITTTGVSELRIAKEAGGAALIDWLAFTLPAGPEGVAVRAAEVAHSLAGQTEVPALDRGALGYTHGYRLPGSGVVFYNPDRVDMGVHVSLSAGALGLVPYYPETLIAHVLELGGKFTRLDVALDCHDTHITVVEAAIRRGDLVSRSEQRTYQGSFVDDGFTIYIGARTSDRFVRIYNKSAEQKMTDGSIWTRAEIEFKKAQAQLAARYIQQGIDLRSLVFSAIDFRDRSADSNTSRCPQLDWWAAWVGIAKKISFAVETVEKTISQKFDWINKQAGPTLAMLDRVFNAGSGWLFELCDNNQGRVPERRRQEIAAMPVRSRIKLADMLLRGDGRPASTGRRSQLPEPGALRLHLGSLSDATFGLVERLA